MFTMMNTLNLKQIQKKSRSRTKGKLLSKKKQKGMNGSTQCITPNSGPLKQSTKNKRF